MSPESQAAKTARLEEQVRSLLEEGRRDNDALTDFRRLLTELTTASATNAYRIHTVEDDIADIKRSVNGCAKAEDVTSLQRVLEKRSDDRRASRGLIIAAALAGAATVIAAAVQQLLS